jgi:hypothetical protein
MWQKAHSLTDGSEFWVMVRKPYKARNVYWHCSNRVYPIGDKIIYVLRAVNSVELLAEFAESVPDDFSLMPRKVF